MGRGVVIEKISKNKYLVLTEGKFCQLKLKGDFNVGDKVIIPAKFSGTLWVKIAALAAALLLFFTPVYLTYAKEREVVAYLTIGGKDGVKIGVNRKEKVVKVLPLNPKNNKYILELKGQTVEKAIEKVSSELGGDVRFEILPGKKFNTKKYQNFLQKNKIDKQSKQNTPKEKGTPPKEKEDKQKNAGSNSFKESVKNVKINNKIMKNQGSEPSGGRSEKSAEKNNSSIGRIFNFNAKSTPRESKLSGGTDKSKGATKRFTQDREPKSKVNR
ncbi:anti-sigma factor domain-containing protein [Carboxydothermus pertinax]|uniref:RsgI N-terminal anti-sigma domain-containing protein n=1 Tax=Carboxydothermus pertinax TaxID=870242 RepID=A0A1L8CXX5_9THEO|nr:hypothetical protein [Carboxydothermus pertinax]GAV23760.1 hypothetical protein cpu_22700 [Carboxydothermus pertinax]